MKVFFSVSLYIVVHVYVCFVVCISMSIIKGKHSVNLPTKQQGFEQQVEILFIFKQTLSDRLALTHKDSHVYTVRLK